MAASVAITSGFNRGSFIHEDVGWKGTASVCVWCRRRADKSVLLPDRSLYSDCFFLFVSVLVVKMSLHRLFSSSSSLAESPSAAVVVRLHPGLSLLVPLSLFSIMLFVRAVKQRQISLALDRETIQSTMSVLECVLLITCYLIPTPNRTGQDKLVPSALNEPKREVQCKFQSSQYL